MSNCTKEQAFTAFVEAHREALSAYLNRRNSQAERTIDAADALQETLIRIWRQWDRWPSDPDQQRAWAYKAAQQAAIDLFRSTYGQDGQKGAVSVDWSSVEQGNHNETDTPVPAISLAVSNMLGAKTMDQSCLALRQWTNRS
jgi:DNA-directed RNA polymerase specialized sigma24 family protein